MAIPWQSLPPVATSPSGNGTAPNALASPTPAAAVVPATSAPVAAAAVGAAVASAGAPAAVADDDDPLVLEAYIDSARCTTCDECTNINNRLFAYNGEKQAYVKDARAGTFQQLVIAAERCPVSIIHPGSPLNAKEKDLAKWLKRAEKFN